MKKWAKKVEGEGREVLRGRNWPKSPKFLSIVSCQRKVRKIGKLLPAHPASNVKVASKLQECSCSKIQGNLQLHSSGWFRYGSCCSGPNLRFS